MMIPTFCAWLLAVTVPAAPVVGDLGAARAALRDGLWNVARLQASAVAGDEARLIVLESLAGEGNWKAVEEKLAEFAESKGDAFDYYRAVVAGDHARAMKILRDTGSVEGCAEAKLHEASQLAAGGDRSGAERIWLELSAATNLGERVFALAGLNLNDPVVLRKVYETVASPDYRQRAGLRLGRLLLAKADTRAEGEKLIRAIVRESPDADGAMESFLAIADMALSAGKGQVAAVAFREALEIWPLASRLSSVQQGLGWALESLGKCEEALEVFRRAEELAKTDDDRATAILKQGDVLSSLSRDEESMARYREALSKYPRSRVADRLRQVVEVRELEAKGRECYREYRFEDARRLFAQVAEKEPARQARMAYFDMLCLYGQGRDDEAGAVASKLAVASPDPLIRAEVTLWRAKFAYNRREWKLSGRLFADYAERRPDTPAAAEALLWAARAAFAENDFERTVKLSTKIVEGGPAAVLRAQALIVQGEALIELTRFDEAVLVFAAAAAVPEAPADERLRARMLLADARFAMGADNPARYREALQAYGELRLEESLDPSVRLTIVFKVARTLERLNRLDEAIDEYYAGVVIAYREGRVRGVRFDESAQAAFTKAAFRLVDEYESRGQDEQALHLLKLVETSDVPAAAEATRRRERISSKGRLL